MPAEVAELLMVSPVSVRRWAQQGQLNAESTPGGHRRFRRHEVERFARKKGLVLQPPDQHTMRILVVDDDKLVAESLVALFAGLPDPIVVEIAHDGFEAGRKVQSFQPHFVLLDLAMPGLDGFQVSSHLKADPITRAVRIIAITAAPTQGNIERIKQLGAEVCLSKPLDIKALLQALGLSATA